MNATAGGERQRSPKAVGLDQRMVEELGDDARVVDRVVSTLLADSPEPRH